MSLSNVIEFRERVSKKLDGTITMSKRVVVCSLLFILLFFASLSGIRPFWLLNLIGVESRIVPKPAPQRKGTKRPKKNSPTTGRKKANAKEKSSELR